MVADALRSRGNISLATLLAALVDADKLRTLARQRGLCPKGYRVERAPIEKLAALYAESTDADLLAEACELLWGSWRANPTDTSTKLIDAESARKHREQELGEARAELRRSREQLDRARQKESSWDKSLRIEKEKVARLKSEIEALRRKAVRSGAAAVPADQTQRIHELEQDLLALGEAEEALRRLLALRVARIHELDTHVLDLEALVPKGRRKKKVAPPAPALADGFRLPYFAPSFAKSLEGKDRRSKEKAYQAILLFCTEGPAYPGLEVKQLEGMEFWSMRASLKLRVYFRLREDGDAEFIALADREDQHTILRRLKER